MEDEFRFENNKTIQPVLIKKTCPMYILKKIGNINSI